MAIAVSSTLGSSGASSLAMIIPAGVGTDDILILSVATRSANTLTVDEDTGETWTEKDKIGTSTTSLSLFWRRVGTSPSGSTIHINNGASAMTGILVSYSGCSTSGDPMEAFNSTQLVTATSNASMTAITAASTGTMIVLVASQSDDRGWSTMGASGTPSSLVRRVERLNSIGNDCSIIHGSNLLASSGPTGTFTWQAATVPVGGNWCAHAFALTPAGAGGEPPPTGAVRLRLRATFGCGA